MQAVYSLPFWQTTIDVLHSACAFLYFTDPSVDRNAFIDWFSSPALFLGLNFHPEPLKDFNDSVLGCQLALNTMPVPRVLGVLGKLVNILSSSSEHSKKLFIWFSPYRSNLTEATGRNFKASLRSFTKKQNCFKWCPGKIRVNTVAANWPVTENLRSNFTFGGTHKEKERVFQPPAEEGLQASFASGDEKMQMVRLKREGLRVLVKVGTSAGEERMWNSLYLCKWL